jgi:uncharacterized protein
VIVWIDLSNSPHPLLFAPVAQRLEAIGDEVLVTARDNAQTAELARARWPGVDVIGGPSPASRLKKAGALARRVRELRRWARRRRPDLALSHNSYSQILAGRLTRTPVVTAMDFEHQPANHLAFRLAQAVLVPDHFPAEATRRQGARNAKLHRYPGLKEEVYLGDFEPDADVLSGLGLNRGEEKLVVVRTPPSRAIYHRFDNPLFMEVLKVIDAQPGVRAVVLARHPEQRRAIGELALRNCLVPERALDSRSLVYAADLFIGAGGTMTREAALMGVPTMSVYAGDPPAVDRALESRGRLVRLVQPDQVASVRKRSHDPEPLTRLRARSDAILGVFVEAIRSSRTRRSP